MCLQIVNTDLIWSSSFCSKTLHQSRDNLKRRQYILFEEVFLLLLNRAYYVAYYELLNFVPKHCSDNSKTTLLVGCNTLRGNWLFGKLIFIGKDLLNKMQELEGWHIYQSNISPYFIIVNGWNIVDQWSRDFTLFYDK